MSELTLLLVRHGIAVERDVFTGTDGDRPLTAKGERKTLHVAQRLLEVGVEGELILSSPLLRARQTAEILLEAGVATELMISDLLTPVGSFNTWLTWLAHWRHDHDGTLILVGHEPNLSHWAEFLLWGKALGHLQLKKAGIIGLKVPQTDPVANSQLFWLTSPKFFVTSRSAS
jgi:phosphohistidine phosphatase